MTKYSIIILKWDILNKDRIKKDCVHKKAVIMGNPLYIY